MTLAVYPGKAARATYRPSIELVDRVLAGDALSIARLISRAEAEYDEASPALAEIYKHTGRAHVVGVTGVPGAGKSTLVSSLIRGFTASGNKVGVIAVDPSSPFSGGAILGDRVRMNDAAEASKAFVRSMATRGHLGGLARSTLQAVDILDAAGYSPILLETVGVGQDEVEIVTAAHTIVVLSAPGLGDDIQAIKAGILEIADIHAVSKADKPEAAATVSALKGMMALGTSKARSTWTSPVLSVSATRNEGVQDLMDAIGGHWAHLTTTGELAQRQRNIVKTRVLASARHIFQKRFNSGIGELEEHLHAVAKRQIDPSAVAQLLLGWNEKALAK